MPTTVTARFESEAEAEQALSTVASQVALADSAVIGGGIAASFTLDSLSLAPDQRSACEEQLKRGGFLLVAQTASDGPAQSVLRVLEEIPASRDRQILPEAGGQIRGDADRPAGKAATVEERIPIVEEEIRIGKREVLRGGARVHSSITEVPVTEQVELFSESTDVTRRPVNRRVSDEEVVAGGLLQERVIEVSEMREEAVVTKEAFVREELVITKKVEQRVEQIQETVRRTHVETETISPDGRTAPGSLWPGEREPSVAGAGEDRNR